MTTVLLLINFILLAGNLFLLAATCLLLVHASKAAAPPDTPVFISRNGSDPAHPELP